MKIVTGDTGDTVKILRLAASAIIVIDVAIVSIAIRATMYIALEIASNAIIVSNVQIVAIVSIAIRATMYIALEIASNAIIVSNVQIVAIALSANVVRKDKIQIGIAANGIAKIAAKIMATIEIPASCYLEALRLNFGLV
ncbi:MAG: hypothetical protein KGO96_07130 [Elusimicrobia bacterium]|nr:hypothetical protein [Elusimicrobiota bacterium]